VVVLTDPVAGIQGKIAGVSVTKKAVTPMQALISKSGALPHSQPAPARFLL